MGFRGFVPGDENGGGDDGKVEDHPCPLRVVDQEEAQEVEEDDGPLTVFLEKKLFKYYKWDLKKSQLIMDHFTAWTM